MLKAMIGKKLNMGMVYDRHGRATPVTKVKVEVNTVLQIKDKETDGYKAVQIGVSEKKHPNKPLLGHVKKAKLDKVPKIIKETDFEGDLTIGQKVNVDEVFRKGSLVDIVGKSKGRGFAGVVKRHGFHGGPKTHGQSDRHRAAGSIGATTTPGRVFKGLKMAGHMGTDRVSVFGLEIMEVDKENETLLVKGSIPGAAGSAVLIKKSKKKAAAYHEPEVQALPNLGGGEEEKPAEGETKTETDQPESNPEVKTEGSVE